METNTVKPSKIVDNSQKIENTKKNRLNLGLISYKNKYNQINSLISSIESFMSLIHLKINPLDNNHIKKILLDYLPKINESETEILLNKAKGNIDLILDFIRQIKSTPGWLTANGEIGISLSKLNELPSIEIEMARNYISRLKPEMRFLLMLAAIQGQEFDLYVTQNLANEFLLTEDIDKILTISDSELGITKLTEHKLLFLVGEFRKHAYLEVAISDFKNHPEANEIKESLLFAYKNIRSDELWDYLEFHQKTRILTNYLLLVGEEVENIELKAYLILELAELKMQFGLYGDAILLAQELIQDFVPADKRIEGRRLYAEIYYRQGNIEKEKECIEEWENSIEFDCPNFFIYSSRLNMRLSNPQKALELTIKGLNTDINSIEKVNLYLTQARSVWLLGEVSKGLEILSDVYSNYNNIIKNEHKIRSLYYHTGCLLLHDLERNLTLISFALKAIEAYDSIGDIESSLICKVNLADAYYAVGEVKKSLELLEHTIKDAKNYYFPHVLDIATICIGNSLVSIGNMDGAIGYYAEGIKLATELNHDWDKLYGRIYFAYCKQIKSGRFNSIEFKRLSQLAKESAYSYLFALCLQFGIIVNCKLGRFKQIEELKRDAEMEDVWEKYPSLQAVYLSSKIMSPESNFNDLVKLLNSIGKMDGIRVDKAFVIEALEKALIDYKQELNEINESFIYRWIGRFGNKRVQIDSPKFRQCKISECEARCCYDGAYLDDDEEQNITLIVKNNLDFFSDIPIDFIVDGYWNGKFNGRKTAVKKYDYKSPDFPNHFEKTRCVFADNSGLCNLQKFSEENLNHKWDLKPRACYMHPLRLNSNKVIAPITLVESDDYFMSINYPGYAKYTPCGQERNDGRPWIVEFKEENDFHKDR